MLLVSRKTKRESEVSVRLRTVRSTFVTSADRSVAANDDRSGVVGVSNAVSIFVLPP